MALFHRLCMVAAVLAFIVVTAGAWVRLTDAGLGCPDWPGCFGHLTVPENRAELARAGQAFPGIEVETGKAWREMIHRYIAAALGLLIIGIAGLAWRGRARPGQSVVLPCVLVGLVIFQGLLGMWTVTLKLQPLVVMGHLLGGLSVLSILVWLTLVSRPGGRPRAGPTSLAPLALVCLVALAAQIALGGWTSTNYAALACPDFPTCQGVWLPPADYAEGFVPWRSIDSSFEGGVLMHPARVAIHFVHRVGALLVTVLLLFAALRAYASGVRSQQLAVTLVLVGLALQLVIGAAIVSSGLPLWLGVAHNGNAALLLLAVVLFNYSTRFTGTKT
jgi:cytochrome c oxidase assembly protein subunit 15